MNPNDVLTVFRGIFWVIFALLPLFLSYGCASEAEAGRPSPLLFIFTLLLQLALIVSIGHSWGKM